MSIEAHKKHQAYGGRRARKGETVRSVVEKLKGKSGKVKEKSKFVQCVDEKHKRSTEAKADPVVRRPLAVATASRQAKQ